MKDDSEIKSQIKKDIDRTMQDLPFFKDPMIMQKLEDLLYVWAKEHTDFKYQQGMNEILAVIILGLMSELLTQDEIKAQEKEITTADGEIDEVSAEAHQIFMALHDPKFLWADAFLLFEKLMDFGIKELYFRTEKPSPEET
jgi:TBC1 domain family protein 5